MRKNRYYNQLSATEISVADACMKSELVGLDYKHPIRTLHLLAWNDYAAGKFAYDGPTFSKRKFYATEFELAAFIHDWRNSLGFVSYAIDNEMFSIMITCNYRLELILQRYLLTRFTFLNIIRHKIKGTFKAEKPQFYYVL